MRALPVVSASLLTLAACAPGSNWRPPDRPCPAPLRAVWMRDPHWTICVPTEFRTQNLATWWRPGPFKAVLAVQFDVAPAQLALTGGWPPRLGAVPDDTTAHFDSVSQRTDTVEGVVFHTEIGRRRGPSPGWHFVAGFRSPDGRLVMATGESARRTTLDRLLLMFHTVAHSPIPDPNRRE